VIEGKRAKVHCHTGSLEKMSESDMARLGEQLAPFITDAVGRGMGAAPTI